MRLEGSEYHNISLFLALHAHKASKFKLPIMILFNLSESDQTNTRITAFFRTTFPIKESSLLITILLCSIRSHNLHHGFYGIADYEADALVDIGA
jgi:hypothetical protein